MRTYLLYIKSGGEAPDYEDTVDAPDIHDAAKLLWEKLGAFGQSQWSPDDLVQYIGLVPDDR